MEMPAADKKIFKKLGRAIRHYELIDGGERIAVAVSGGKDSLSLLWLLRERLRWIPKPYELIAAAWGFPFISRRPIMGFGPTVLKIGRTPASFARGFAAGTFLKWPTP
jgi:hypothetical protein